MKKVMMIILTISVVIIFISCKGETNNISAINRVSEQPTITESGFQTPNVIKVKNDDKTIQIFKDNNSPQDEVQIRSSYEKPLSIDDKNTISLKGLLDGNEYIEITVIGEIIDFEHVAVIWDDSKKELIEKETIRKIEKLTNQTLVIKTYQPDGIPVEKIKWKSKAGKSYEFIIKESLK